MLTQAERIKIVKWMMQEADKNGDKFIASKAVRNFLLLFTKNTTANLTKASRLWKTRFEFFDSNNCVVTRGITSTVTRVSRDGLKRVYLKAKSGRGRKRPQDLVTEFERLRKLGVNFNAKNLRSLAIHLLENSTSDNYNSVMFSPGTEKPLKQMITPRWIQRFQQRFNIVSRKQTGKLMVSPAKQEFIEREVAFHLGCMARQFRSGELDENNLENADETHFQINFDNGRTLGFSGEDDVKYADVVSGGDGMTMVVRISGGRDARIEPPFMVFQNKARSYPIRMQDDVEGVSYRRGPKGWMDSTVMPVVGRTESDGPFASLSETNSFCRQLQWTQRDA